MEDQANKILDVQNLVVHYVLEEETVEAVNGVTIQLEKGKTLGLVGETGAGKTTTALSLMRLVPDPPGVIKSGTISVCGHNMMELNVAQLEKVRGKDVAMIFQDPMSALNPVYTVGHQIAESIEIHEKLSKRDAYEKACEMLELVEIPRERASDYPHQFSGGMKQRVVIAIALACNPKLLIADEPTTALDVTIQAQVLNLIGQLQQQYQMTMLVITHDLGIVAEVCDDVMVMYAGKVVEQGTLDEVFNHTKHPYTEGLFNSLPNITDRKSELIPIPGLMPDPTNLPVGCSFAPRCFYVTEECLAQEPPVHHFSDTHCARCVQYDKPDFHIKRGISHER